MLDMTSPDFEAAVKKTDIVLLPIGAIEEHSSHLPPGTHAMNATAQMFQVQQYLRKAGFETILGPLQSFCRRHVLTKPRALDSTVVKLVPVKTA
jgi:creatinine amidohydrolase/Fe(II)-dependent formamide hydrolase-like protein